MRKTLIIGMAALLLTVLLVGGVVGASALVQRYGGPELAQEGAAAVTEALGSAVEQLTPNSPESNHEFEVSVIQVEQEPGVLLLGVAADSPAAEIGLRRGDILLAVDGEEVNTPSELRTAIREREPGTTVTLLVLRCEEPEEMVVTLGEDESGEHAYLGVSLQPQMPGDLHFHSLGEGEFEIERELIYEPAALVQEVVENSPAEEVGLQEGDRITAVDGERVTMARPLASIIRSFAVGDTVELEFERDAESMTVEVTLAEHPDEEGAAFLGVHVARHAEFGLGELPAFPMPHLEHFEFGEGTYTGAVVTEVAAGSAAEAAGVQEGDLIQSVDGEPLDEPGVLVELIAAREPGDEVELAIMRDGEELILRAVLGASPDDETAAYLGVSASAFVHVEKHIGGDEDGHRFPWLDHVPWVDRFPWIGRFRSEHDEMDFDFQWLDEESLELHELPSPLWPVPSGSEV